MPKLGVQIDVPCLHIQVRLLDDRHVRLALWSGLPEAHLVKRLLFLFRMLLRQRALRRPLVHRPPGSRLNAIGEFVFSKKTHERVIEPTIADLQEEYVAALAQNRVWKARWVWVRGHYSFWSAVALQLPISAVRLVVKIWKTAGT